MKRKINKWMQVCLAVLPLSVLTYQARAQFTNAVIPETFVGANVSAGNTGNDIRNSVTGLGIMSVNVWDGPGAGLSWDDMAGNAGFLTFTAPTQDPDVTVIEGGGIWWACVAYFSPGTGYICDVYKWTGTGFGFSFSNPLSGCTTPGLSINIDGDVTGDFVIVYEDRCASRLFVAGGSTFLTGAPVFCNGGVPLAVTNSGGMVYPDVTLWSVDGVTPQYGIFYLTYLTPNFKRIVVTYDKFTTLCSNFSNNILLFVNGTPFSYYTPRIACPPAGTGTILDFAAVVTEINPGGYDVFGFTRNAGVVNTVNYTNGTVIAPAISMWNKYPAVTYDGGYQGIIFSWKSFYTLAANFFPAAPVAIQCDVFGNYIGGFMCGNGYMIVPFFNPLAGPGEDAISVAGRDYGRIMYTFVDNNFPDILWKQVPFTNCSLRSASSNSSAGDDKESLVPNPVSNEFTLKLPAVKDDEIIRMQIIDMNGKTVIEFNGTVLSINEHATEIASKLAAGMYVMSFSTTKENYKLRLVKM